MAVVGKTVERAFVGALQRLEWLTPESGGFSTSSPLWGLLAG